MLITDTFLYNKLALPERARRPPALAHGAVLVRGAEPLVAFQDAGAPFRADFGPAAHGHAALLARDRTRRLRPPRRAVRVLLDVERLPRGGLPCFSDAFVEAEVVLRRLALRVVEVARDDLRGRGFLFLFFFVPRLSPLVHFVVRFRAAPKQAPPSSPVGSAVGSELGSAVGSAVGSFAGSAVGSAVCHDIEQTPRSLKRPRHAIAATQRR